MTDEERIEAVAAAIRRYLEIRPDAADTLEGIHNWWIDWDDEKGPVDYTAAALQLLANSGCIQMRRIGSRTIWSKPR